MLSNIDIKKAEAMKEADREKIFFVIQRTLGFQQLNAVVIECLSDWYLNEIVSSLSQSSDLIDLKFQKLKAVAKLFLTQGMYPIAKKYYNEIILLHKEQRDFLHDENEGNELNFIEELWTPRITDSEDSVLLDLEITRSVVNLIHCQLAEELAHITPSTERIKFQLQQLIGLHESVSEYIHSHFLLEMNPEMTQQPQDNHLFREMSSLSAIILHLIGKHFFELEDYFNSEIYFQYLSSPLRSSLLSIRIWQYIH
jgi:hypothetical protein